MNSFYNSCTEDERHLHGSIVNDEISNFYFGIAHSKIPLIFMEGL